MISIEREEELLAQARARPTPVSVEQQWRKVYDQLQAEESCDADHVNWCTIRAILFGENDERRLLAEYFEHIYKYVMFTAIYLYPRSDIAQKERIKEFPFRQLKSDLYAWMARDQPLTNDVRKILSKYEKEWIQSGRQIPLKWLTEPIIKTNNVSSTKTTLDMTKDHLLALITSLTSPSLVPVAGPIPVAVPVPIPVTSTSVQTPIPKEDNEVSPTSASKAENPNQDDDHNDKRVKTIDGTTSLTNATSFSSSSSSCSRSVAQVTDDAMNIAKINRFIRKHGQKPNRYEVTFVNGLLHTFSAEEAQKIPGFSDALRIFDRDIFPKQQETNRHKRSVAGDRTKD
jgi:hypothetical protein